MKNNHPDFTEMDAMKLSREISDLECKKLELEKRLTELLKSDPETIARLGEQLQDLKESVNIWTDNIFIIRQFVCSKMGISESYVNEAFQIPPDLDLLEV